jgi:acetyl esterase/lipase
MTFSILELQRFFPQLQKTVLGAALLFHMETIQSTPIEPDSNYRIEREIAYSPELKGTPGAEKCVLDLYLPTDIKNFPTIIYFHGGGLAGGQRSIPKELMNLGWAVVAVSYRLSPTVKCPAYIEDAAAATAWTFKNMESYGGNPKKIFLFGISAGGYLAAMVTLDPVYLQKHGIDANQVAGLISVSGQMITHQTVRKEMGIEPSNHRPTIDRFAPLYHIRKDAPPALCTTGDWATDTLMRAEENLYFVSMMKLVGHPDIEHVVLKEANHTRACKESWPHVLAFVKEKLASPSAPVTAPPATDNPK